RAKDRIVGNSNRHSALVYSLLNGIRNYNNNVVTLINGSAKTMKSESGIFFNSVQILHSYRFFSNEPLKNIYFVEYSPLQI
ncbi:hypothetical protein BpHYR1_016766, partial [Brachionus plicatilis]